MSDWERRDYLVFSLGKPQEAYTCLRWPVAKVYAVRAEDEVSAAKATMDAADTLGPFRVVECVTVDLGEDNDLYGSRLDQGPR